MGQMGTGRGFEPGRGAARAACRGGIPEALVLLEERRSRNEREETCMSDDLTAWLAAPGALDDAEIDAFLARVREERDAKRASAAVAALIGSPRLSLAQLERIARSDRELMRRHEALIQRTYLARRLEAAVSDELLEQVLELKDASIQTRLVRDARLTRKQAERLARRGANPTLRANAEAWLKDKKAWGHGGRAG
jgi:hypothetical protein